MNSFSPSRANCVGSGAQIGSMGIWVLVGICWLLMFSTFSLPSRSGPLTLGAMDWIAIMKVITRLVAILLLGGTLLWTPKTPNVRRVIWRLFPLGIFALWGITSTIWSSMKAVSLGHSMEIWLFTMLSAVTGIVCVDDKRLSKLFCLLWLGISLISFLLLTMYYWVPNLGDLDRGPAIQGLIYPGHVGEMASSTVVMILGCTLLWKWRWLRLALPLSVLLGGWLMYVARGRMAIFLCIFLCFIWILLLGSRKVLLSFLIIFCITATSYIFIDPNMELYDTVINKAGTYIMREQTKEEFLSGTGRSELWKMTWNSFWKSPFYGHGYFMSSPTGILDVWGAKQSVLPHNLFLQVLVNMGLIGGILFFWALWRPLYPIRSALKGDPGKQKLGIFVLIITLWYIGYGLIDASFLGPIRPASLLFFITLGIAAGRL